jgi:hypothetical protein
VRLDGDAWREFFDAYEREAFRLETLSRYIMEEEEEDFRKFLETGEVYIPDDDTWFVRVRKFRETGRWIGRVHVVEQPLSDYLRSELAAYKFNVRHGEEVRILDLTGKECPSLPEKDFWMFDDSKVVEMLYRPDGTQIGRELLENPNIEQYRKWKETALLLSVPLAEYEAD